MAAYKPCGCGAECYVTVLGLQKEDGACWGKVWAVEELQDESGNFVGYVHACKGHANDFPYGDYIEPPA